MCAGGYVSRAAHARCLASTFNMRQRGVLCLLVLGGVECPPSLSAV